MTRSILALAAAAVCASSKCLSAARRPNINNRNARSRSGSIRHDDAQHSAKSRAYPNRSIGRNGFSASRAYQTIAYRPRYTLANNNACFSLNPDCQNCHRVIAARRTHSAHYRQIPIAAPLLTPNLPRVPSLTAFGRRPRCQAASPTWGRHPKPITFSDIPGHPVDGPLYSRKLPW